MERTSGPHGGWDAAERPGGAPAPSRMGGTTSLWLRSLERSHLATAKLSNGADTGGFITPPRLLKISTHVFSAETVFLSRSHTQRRENVSGCGGKGFLQTRRGQLAGMAGPQEGRAPDASRLWRCPRHECSSRPECAGPRTGPEDTCTFGVGVRAPRPPPRPGSVLGRVWGMSETLAQDRVWVEGWWLA